MKKLIILILWVLILTSCSKREKPFVIIDKLFFNGSITYKYQDKNNNKYTFNDTIVYCIGDTIK